MALDSTTRPLDARPGDGRVDSRITEALAFDDVLVVPAYSQVLPSTVSTRTQLTRTRPSRCRS